MLPRLAVLLLLACAPFARAGDSFTPDSNNRGGDGSALTPGQAADLMNPPSPGASTGGGNPDGGGLHKGEGGGGSRRLGTATIVPPAGGDPAAAEGRAGADGAGARAAAPSVSPFGAGSELAIKAGVELQMGDLAAACETSRAALAADPKDAKALKVESLACRVGLSGGAKDVAGDGLRPGPGSRDVALDTNSRSKLLRGERGGGTVTGPGALQAWLVRVTETKERGDDAQVILLCDEALREFPGNLHLLNAKATAQNKLKDFKGALATALSALDVDPDNAAAHANKAFALGGLGDREGMLEALRRAAALDPRFEAALKAALAGDAAGLFGDVGAARGKPLPKEVWILGSAALGFFVMLALVLLARRAAPRPEPAPAAAGPIAPRTLGRGDVLGGNFRVDGELGRGGMGVVFDAFDQKLERRVAIKQLLRDASTTDDDRARFLREARVVAQLKHPNLAEIYTVLDEKGEHLLVFEFVDGRTLDKVIATNRGVPLAQAAKILGEISSALDYAHGRKIIHRDLKPSNVMISRDGAVKVMDFGIAHQASSTAGMTRTAASGTPAYMAPEQGLGSVSKASDLYALGVMAYEMVSGARPFDGPDFLEQKLRMAYTPAGRRVAALPAGLDAFFTAALEADPTKRPATGADFHRAFVTACG